MKNISILLVSLILLLTSYVEPVIAQSNLILNWAKGLGDWSDDTGNSIAVDNSGNVYVTGTFYGTVDFDPSGSIAELTSFGQSDVFLAKFDAAGNLIFANNMGGVFDDGGYSLALDDLGNVYITGRFSGTAEFDPSANVVNLSSLGGSEIFIAKYDADGNYLYANGIGGIDDEDGFAITVDAVGNAYVTGRFSGTVDFDPAAGTANLTSAGNYDIFFAKYDTNGDFIYANGMGGASSTDHGASIAVDDNGNAYLTGYFSGTVDFDPSSNTANLTSAGFWDIFIAKYDGNGNYVYAKNIGGPDLDLGQSIAIDGQGNAYLTGYFQNEADFDPSANTTYLTSAGGYDIFMAKYDSDGNLIYAKNIGGESDDLGSSVVLDDFDNVLFTGRFSDTCDFDPSGGVANLNSAGGFDVFLAKFDSNGNYIYAESMGGPGNDDGFTMTVNGSGELYVAGIFEGTADFDPNTGVTNLMSQGQYDIFIARYTEEPNSISENQHEIFDWTVYPNPTESQVLIDLKSTFQDVNVNVYSSLGALVVERSVSSTQIIDLTLPNERGIYVVQLLFSDGSTDSLKVLKE